MLPKEAALANPKLSEKEREMLAKIYWIIEQDPPFRDRLMEVVRDAQDQWDEARRLGYKTPREMLDARKTVDDARKTEEENTHASPREDN